MAPMSSAFLIVKGQKHPVNMSPESEGLPFDGFSGLGGLTFVCFMDFQAFEGEKERKQEATPARRQCSIGVEALALDLELNLHGDLPLSYPCSLSQCHFLTG